MISLRVIKSAVIPLSAAVSAAAAVWLFGGHQLCFFKGLIGIPCPGCGMTRAWVNVLSGDFRTAFFWHPLFWTLPLAAGLFLYERLGRKSFKAEGIWIAVLSAFILVYLIRMLLFFPSALPLEFNSHAVVPGIISAFVR